MESAAFTTTLVQDRVATSQPEAISSWRALQRAGIGVAVWGRSIAVVSLDLVATAALLGVLEGGITVRVVVIALLAPIALTCVGAQSPSWRRDFAFSARIGRLAFAAIASLWLGTALASTFHPAGSLQALLGATVALPAAWVITRAVSGTWFSAKPIRTLVVGSPRGVDEFVYASRSDDDSTDELVGYVDDSSARPERLAPCRRLGGLGDLPVVLSRVTVDRAVIVGAHRMPGGSLVAILRACDAVGIEVDIASRALAGAPENASVSFHGGVPLLRVRKRRAGKWQHVIKRSLDVVAASTALFVLTPVLGFIALVALIAQGRPLFFLQARVGRDGCDFQIFKFRTMARDAEERTRSYADSVEAGRRSISEAVSGLKAAAQCHVTPLGTFLRKTSLDELPQLWNVIRGDMSLVGPRPLRRFEHDKLEPAVADQRSKMRPGITGLWQVRGRSEVDWDERTNLDYSHVRNWALSHDLAMMVETIPAMLKGR
jgi:lipopolysaccharide/colanic/teichoic acid biosynthesis glycosyltransferase